MPLFVIATVPALTSPDPPSVMPPLVINVRVLAAPTPSVPLRVSGTVSVRAKSPPVTTNEPRVVTVPLRLTEPLALPDSVPAISVPDSLIVPVVAISDTVPAPPSVIVPGTAMLPDFKLTVGALSVLPMVSSPVSTSVKLFVEMLPRLPITLLPLSNDHVVPLPVSVPTSKGPPGSVIAPLVKSARTAAVPPVAKSALPSIEMPVAVCVIVPPFGTSV